MNTDDAPLRWATEDAQRTWRRVDEYFATSLLGEDEVLARTLQRNSDAGLPEHDVTPLQGQFLNIMVQAVGARRVLEVGTLGGYSTIWMARALPDNGSITSIEVNDGHASLARYNIDRAGLSACATVIVGPARAVLQDMINTGERPFDFIFLDANKEESAIYIKLSLALSRRGTLIIADNVVRAGDIADESSEDARVIGLRDMVDFMSAEPRLRVTAIQTVGSKGYDGWVCALVI